MIVKYNKTVSFEGRNGYFKCNGIGIDSYDSERIELYPITSKGEAGRGMIQVPKENIQELIDALKQLL